MATQSLYRRYRPRRFSELKGQDHVVRALRDAVRSGREGQAYLFSGPRGTGKTTSARILAKVLNCAAPVDGEPCCVCDSCLAVEQGTSYDVHELDAASNNGVDAIRDLVEKASLGTPGRHRVYILDEVHMLSRAAEAALLKTLEEPPSHVVFVLATTDPQKMSDTIRSRTQHLQFHLLPPDTLADHVRWVAADAGLDLDPDQLDAVVDSVVDAGGGSARDTLSALELIVATGGTVTDRLDLDAFVEAVADREPGGVLTFVAQAVRAGHEPRTLTEALVRHLRDCFLSTMAPELVQLPTARVEQLAEQSRALGAPMLVRTIEELGAALVEMRHAPDPRVLLEVALIRLTHEQVGGTDVAALAARVDRLEHAVGALGSSFAGGAGAGGGSAPGAGPSAPVDPGTGRAVVGGRARRNQAAPQTDPTAPSTTGGDDVAPAPEADTDHRAAGAPVDAVPDDGPGGGPDDRSDSRPGQRPDTASNVRARQGRQSRASGHQDDTEPTQPESAAPAESTEPSAPGAAPSAPASGDRIDPESLRAAWDEAVRPGLKPLVRALYSAGSFGRTEGATCYFDAPNEVHAGKCRAHRESVQRALSDALGTPVTLVIAVGGHVDDDIDDIAPGRAAPGGRARSPSSGPQGSRSSGSGSGSERRGAEPDVSPSSTGASPSSRPSVTGPGSSGGARASDPTVDAGATDQEHVDGALARSPQEFPDDADIDLDDLIDAPPESVVTPIDRLAQAFPGSELIDDEP